MMILSITNQIPMALSDQTIENLSEVLCDDVAEAIQQSDEWIDFMMQQVRIAVTQKLGEVHENLLDELSVKIFYQLYLTSKS